MNWPPSGTQTQLSNWFPAFSLLPPIHSLLWRAGVMLEKPTYDHYSPAYSSVVTLHCLLDKFKPLGKREAAAQITNMSGGAPFHAPATSH